MSAYQCETLLTEDGRACNKRASYWLVGRSGAALCAECAEGVEVAMRVKPEVWRGLSLTNASRPEPVKGQLEAPAWEPPLVQ